MPTTEQLREIDKAIRRWLARREAEQLARPKSLGKEQDQQKEQNGYDETANNNI